MEVADPSTSGATPDAAPPAVNGSAEAATPGTEGTAKKVKKEKKVSKLSNNQGADSVCCFFYAVYMLFSWLFSVGFFVCLTCKVCLFLNRYLQGCR